MFDRLFIEALLHPERVGDEADQLATHLRNDAQEDRESCVLEGEGAPEGAELDAVSGQPLSDLLEMLVRYHIEVGGGQVLSQPDGSLLVTWPDETVGERIFFPGAGEDTEGELVTLGHPRVRRLVGRTPVHGKGEPIACLTSDGLPKSVDGIWSLWVLRLSSFDFQRARVFPVYVNREGRAFAQTARHVWDQLAAVDMNQNGMLQGQPGLDAYDLVHEAATTEGSAYWEEMQRDHLQRWEEEQAKAQHHFASRRRMLKGVGLAEVRGYRLRQLETEEAERARELAAQKSLLPELEPLTILSLSSL